ncbi:MAG: InlB B-repeat-containing protein [Bacteroidales bacterium]|nr:InlB B-repeat-containing protein [Bacteroidales bacterium]
MKKTLFLLFAIVSMAGMIAISGCNKTYTVVFDANGGTGTMAPQEFTGGESQALMRNAFTYEGYTFSGWNTVRDGSGASYPDGYTLTVSSDMTLYAQWTSNGTSPTPSPTPTNSLNGHEFVDLGLPSGLLWATCNVGATTPEGYGSYFAWGETAAKENYNWTTYAHSNGDEHSITKYCDESEYGYNGFTDNLTVLEASDDAATANWGAGWRMPTKAEMQELYDNCTHEYTTQNGVNGRLFTASNGKSIFLPAAGGYSDNTLNNAGADGYYWSSSLATDSPRGAFSLFFYDNSGYDLDDFERTEGISVRPVCMPAQK